MVDQNLLMPLISYGFDKVLLKSDIQNHIIQKFYSYFHKSNKELIENFIKKTSLIHYSKKAFQKEASDVIKLAEIEGLTAHANCIKIRQ